MPQCCSASANRFYLYMFLYLPVLLLNDSVSSTWSGFVAGSTIVVMRHTNIAMARRGNTATYSINGPTRTTKVRSAIILDGRCSTSSRNHFRLWCYCRRL